MSSIIALSEPSPSTPVDRARGVIEFVEAHGLRQSACRIDGQHAHATAHFGRPQAGAQLRSSSCRRRRSRSTR